MYYDLDYDYSLIEASIAKQYGIRLSVDNTVLWPEFITLVSGLMHDTPLGQVMSIRSEKDPKRLREFTPEQRRIRNEWILYRNNKRKEDPVAYQNYLKGLQEWCKANFSKKG